MLLAPLFLSLLFFGFVDTQSQQGWDLLDKKRPVPGVDIRPKLIFIIHAKEDAVALLPVLEVE